MAERWNTDYDIVVPAPEYDALVHDSFKYHRLVSALIQETSLSYDKDHLIVDISCQDALTLIKHFEPYAYEGRVSQLKGAESDDD